MLRRELTVPTQGRGSYDVSDAVEAVVTEWAKMTPSQGMCNVFIVHTSASLIISENADPDVRVDLERFLNDLVPDGDPRYRHRDEGPDDMPAHVRSVLTQSSITIPVVAGRLALGTWQGLYLYEHRHAAHQRRLIVSVW